MTHFFGQKTIMKHTGQMKKKIFANKQVIYNTNPVHAIYFQRCQKTVQYDFRDAVSCLVFMLTVCRIGVDEGTYIQISCE